MGPGCSLYLMNIRPSYSLYLKVWDQVILYTWRIWDQVRYSLYLENIGPSYSLYLENIGY